MIFYTIFAIILCSSLQVSNARPFIDGLDAHSILNYALTSSYVPSSAKGVLAAGKAVYHGVDKYIETGDVYAVSDAIINSTLKSGDDIYKTSTTVNLAKSGILLLQDIIDGKNVQNSLSERALEALDHLSLADLTKIAIEGAKDLQDGKSIEDILSKGSQNALEKYAAKAGLEGVLDSIGQENIKNVLDGGVKAISGLFG